jgi:hypothetical protein
MNTFITLDARESAALMVEIAKNDFDMRSVTVRVASNSKGRADELESPE